MRDLDGQPGAVAGVLLGAGGAAVLEVDEDGQRVANDGVGRPAGDVHDEAEAARVVLEGRVIQTLGSRTASLAQLGFHPRIRCPPPFWIGGGADRSPCSVSRSPLSVAETRVSPGRSGVKVAKVAIGNDTATLGPGAPLRRWPAARSGRRRRPFGGGGSPRHLRPVEARRRPDRARLPTPPRRRSVPGGPDGEAGAATLPGNCQEVQIVATDAPRSSDAGQSKDTRPR